MMLEEPLSEVGSDMAGEEKVPLGEFNDATTDDQSDDKSNDDSVASDLDDSDASLSWSTGDEEQPALTQLGPTSGITASSSVPTTSGIAQNVDMIQFLITTLYKLPIRRPAAVERLKKKIFCMASHYQHFDVLFVQDLLPALDATVAVRLGRLISLRRHTLAYREDHNEHLQPLERQQGSFSEALSLPPDRQDALQDAGYLPGLTSKHSAPSAAATLEEGSQQSSLPSKATTHRRQEGEEGFEYAPSMATSEASRASSYAVKHLQVAIPPIPTNKCGTLTHFLCPYCSITQHITSERMWRKHVLNDLQPYVCTYPGCAYEDHFFPNREKWYQHELHEHRLVWQCNAREHSNPKEYLDKADFLRHMSVAHNVSFEPAEINSLSSLFRQPSRNADGTCNLCGHISQNLRSHVAKHLQRLALFALPKAKAAANSDSAKAQESYAAPSELATSLDSEQSIAASGEPISERFPAMNADFEDSDDLASVFEADKDDHTIPDSEDDPAWYRAFSRERSATRCRTLIAEIRAAESPNTLMLALGRELKQLDSPDEIETVRVLVYEFREALLDLRRTYPTLHSTLSQDFWKRAVIHFDLENLIREDWSELRGPKLLSPALRLTNSPLAEGPPNPSTIRFLLERGENYNDFDSEIHATPLTNSSKSYSMLEPLQTNIISSHKIKHEPVFLEVMQHPRPRLPQGPTPDMGAASLRQQMLYQEENGRMERIHRSQMQAVQRQREQQERDFACARAQELERRVSERRLLEGGRVGSIRSMRSGGNSGTPGRPVFDLPAAEDEETVMRASSYPGQEWAPKYVDD